MTYASILLRNEDLRLQIKVELTTYLLKVPNFQELRRSSSRIRETFLKCTYKVTANETHTLNQTLLCRKIKIIFNVDDASATRRGMQI